MFLNNPLISSITITYNPEISTLHKQILSISNQVDNIIVVDNGSINFKEINELVKSFSTDENVSIILKSLVGNIGLGAAQNIGISVAKDNNSSDVLFLDQDSILEVDFVYHLSNTRDSLINNKIKVGAIGPIFFDSDSKKQFPVFNLKGPFLINIIPKNNPIQTSFLISSGSFISLDVLEKVGFMNEFFFVDYIDVEWCYRCQSNGYKLFVTPNSKMTHTIGDRRINIFSRSLSVHSPLRRYYLIRNFIYILSIGYIPFNYKLREFFLNIFRFSITILFLKNRMRYLKSSFFAILDASRNNYGICKRVL